MNELTITKGNEVLDFGGSNFTVLWGKFAPKVTQRRRSLLGGSMYEDSDEQWQIDIVGGSSTDSLIAADDLARVIESAADWLEGQDDDVVVLSYQPPNSTLPSALKTVIIGSPRNRAALALPGDFDTVGTVKRIRNARLGFERRGAWLAEGETQASSATATPGEMVATFAGEAKNLSPIDVKLTGFDSSTDTTFNFPAGVLFVYADATDCKLWGVDDVGRNIFG